MPGREKIMADSQKEEQVRAVLASYVEGCRLGDLDLLKKIFHPDAAMSGYLAGSLLVGGPEPFFQAVAGNPAPAASNAPYEASIEAVQVSGKMATGVLRESGFLGMDFVDYFQLLEIDGSWKIVSKLFESR
jgi:hypothetical protein